MSVIEHLDDASTAALKASPAVGGAALSVMTLNEWVAAATLCYIVLQIGLLMPKYFKVIRGFLEGKYSEPSGHDDE